MKRGVRELLRLQTGRGLIVLFAVTMFLPGILLAVLGLRAFYQERRLAGQQIRERLERAADLAFRELELELSRWQQAVDQAGEISPLERLPLPPDAARDLAEVPGAGVLVIREADGLLALPPGQLLYQLVSSPAPSPVDTPYPRLLEAETYEIRDNDYQRAAADSKNEVIRARDLATGQERVVCRPPSWPNGLAIPPDGRQLALYEGWEQNSSLSVAPIATGQLRTLFSSSQRIKTIAWTPDGRHLLFGLTQPAGSTGSTAATDLCLIPAEGGQPRKLDLTMDSLADLRVHPDGRHIAFVAGSHKGEVWIMENFLPGTK